MSFGDETLNPTYAEEDHLRRQVADLTDEIERLRREQLFTNNPANHVQKKQEKHEQEKHKDTKGNKQKEK